MFYWLWVCRAPSSHGRSLRLSLWATLDFGHDVCPASPAAPKTHTHTHIQIPFISSFLIQSAGTSDQNQVTCQVDFHMQVISPRILVHDNTVCLMWLVCRKCECRCHNCFTGSHNSMPVTVKWKVVLSLCDPHIRMFGCFYTAASPLKCLLNTKHSCGPLFCWHRLDSYVSSVVNRTYCKVLINWENVYFFRLAISYMYCKWKKLMLRNHSCSHLHNSCHWLAVVPH